MRFIGFPLRVRRIGFGITIGGAIALAAILTASACSSSSPAPGGGEVGGGADASDARATSACVGDPAACLRGTIDTSAFGPSWLFGRVLVYPTYPAGDVRPVGASDTDAAVGGVAIATDGTFAVSGLAPSSHYYARALVRFDPIDTGAVVEAVIGPLTIPAPAPAPLTLPLRAAFVEVAQTQYASGAAPVVAWAAAKIYDPATGRAIPDATVALDAEGGAVPMPWVPDAAGANGGGGAGRYFVTAPAGIAAGGAFTVRASHAAIGAATFTVSGDGSSPAARLDAPKDGDAIAAAAPLKVAWTADARTTGVMPQLFATSGSTQTFRWQPVAALPPEVTEATIPPEAIEPGALLLVLQATRSTCAATADGCVHAQVDDSVHLNAR